MIIHISGPSGAGKTTLGNKIKEKFGNKIIVEDIDILRNNFIEHTYGNIAFNAVKFEKNKYQKWIDDFIKKNKKPIVFVGLNNNYPWWHKNHYYDMHADYNFYIKIDDEIVFKQKCERMIESFYKDKDKISRDFIKNEIQTSKDIIRDIKHECSYSNTIKMSKEWEKNYKKQNYIFSSREDIYKKTVELLNKELK
jgi:adenylate kinase family enzyme